MCGGFLQILLDRAGGNATYTSKMAVVEFMNALGTWVKSLYSSGFIRHPFLASWLMNALMLLPYRESGVPEEHFIELLPLKKANAESTILH